MSRESRFMNSRTISPKHTLQSRLVGAALRFRSTLRHPDLYRDCAMLLRYFIPIIVGLLFLTGVLWLWVARLPTPSPVRVILVGTTNDSSGTLLYCFQATNSAEREFIVSYQT